jgi:hypothetical protein
MASEAQRAACRKLENPVHEHKQSTDASYDSLALSLLVHMDQQQEEQRRLALESGSKPLPRLSSRTKVLFATHSRVSIEHILGFLPAFDDRDAVHFAQIQGMCSHVTEALGKLGYNAHKLVLYGDYNLLLPWLFRRLEENQDGLGAVQSEQAVLRKHIIQRLFGNCLRW